MSVSPPLSLYDYDLPEDRIAQVPLPDRASARLLVVRRDSDEFEEARVSDLGGFLRADDCLVLNDTRVSACRLKGRVDGADAEILVVEKKERTPREWDVDALVYPGKKFRVGGEVEFEVAPKTGSSAAARLRVAVRDVSDIGRRMTLSPADPSVTIGDFFSAHGRVPMPPYVRNPSIDPERYQTCYAREEGSSAAPTAGLHFTPDLLASLKSHGVETAHLTLHVGPGTFRPVTEAELSSGKLHREPYWLGTRCAETIRRSRKRGGRTVAVGTTACRTIEWVASKFGEIREDAGETDLFIREGWAFRAVDAMLTNFHLPKTSLLMLVAALAGRERILAAYRFALERGFRFYSFGDAMLIL